MYLYVLFRYVTFKTFPEDVFAHSVLEHPQNSTSYKRKNFVGTYTYKKNNRKRYICRMLLNRKLS